MHLDEHLLCAHDLDDLANIGTRLLKQAELFSEEAHPRVVVIPLCFETAEDSLTLEDLELHRLDLIVVVVIERHLGGCAVVMSLSNEALVVDRRGRRKGVVGLDWRRPNISARTGRNFNCSLRGNNFGMRFKCKCCQLRRRLVDGIWGQMIVVSALCRRRRNSAQGSSGQRNAVKSSNWRRQHGRDAQGSA